MKRSDTIKDILVVSAPMIVGSFVAALLWLGGHLLAAIFVMLLTVAICFWLIVDCFHWYRVR